VARESTKAALEIAKQDEMDARLAWEEENNSNMVSEDESTTSKTIKKKPSSSKTKSKSKKERERRTSRKSDHKDPSMRKHRSQRDPSSRKDCNQKDPSAEVRKGRPSKITTQVFSKLAKMFLIDADVQHPDTICSLHHRRLTSDNSTAFIVEKA
jgi:hypothetical protein